MYGKAIDYVLTVAATTVLDASVHGFNIARTFWYSSYCLPLSSASDT